MKHSIVKSGTALAVVLSSVLVGAAQGAEMGFHPWAYNTVAGDPGEPSSSRTLIGFHPWDMESTKNAAAAEGYAELGALEIADVGVVGFRPWYAN